MRTTKLLCLLFAPLFFGFCATVEGQRKGIMVEYPELKNPVVAARGAAVDSSLSGPIIFALCSQTKPRTAEAYVQWPAAQLKSFDKMRLDVTFYKQGFNTNRYAIIWPLQQNKKARLADPKMAQSPEVMAGLELEVISMSRGDAGQPAVLKLEGLDPGKTYYWRVLRQGQRDWQSSEVIRIEAPTCPVDMIDKQ